MIAAIADYVTYAGDSTTASSAVNQALIDAQADMEQIASRKFELNTYTEVVRLYPTGRVYPKAFPITNVVNSSGAVIDGASVILGYGFQYATGVNPFVSGFGQDVSNYQPQVTLTYTGGYAPSQMPPELKRICCEIAYNALHPVHADVPYGVNNVHIGDAGYSGTMLASRQAIDANLYRRIRRWRRPMAVAF